VAHHGSKGYLAREIEADKTYRYARCPPHFESTNGVRRNLAAALLDPMHDDLAEEHPQPDTQRPVVNELSQIWHGGRPRAGDMRQQRIPV
jgi:hypothetical protein